MSPKEFKKNWEEIGEKLSKFSINALINFNLNANTIEFLTHAGLPSQAAPNLDFAQNDGDIHYNNIERLTEIYTINSSFDKYIAIGSDGYGNPIVINTENNDAIELLDHERQFEKICDINSTINSLAKSLLVYRAFVYELLAKNGDTAFVYRNFSDDQFSKVKSDLLIADKLSVENGFWKMELESLLSEREYYKKENHDRFS